MCNICKEPVCCCSPYPQHIVNINNTLQGKDGESAYEIAVRTGQFTGTEQEFIIWLKGPKGDQGDEGEQGEPGINLAENGVSINDGTGAVELGGPLTNLTTVIGDQEGGNFFQLSQLLGYQFSTKTDLGLVGFELSPNYITLYRADTNYNQQAFVINSQAGISPSMMIFDEVQQIGLGDAQDYSANKTQYSYVTKKMLDAASVNITASNGLTRTTNTIELGGTIDTPTPLSIAENSALIIAGTRDGSGFITVGDIIGANSLTLGTKTAEGATKSILYFYDDIASSTGGIELNDHYQKGITEMGDYSANKTDYSYVTKKMLDAATSIQTGSGLRIDNDGKVILGLDPATVGTTNKGILTESLYLSKGDFATGAVNIIQLTDPVVGISINKASNITAGFNIGKASDALSTSNFISDGLTSVVCGFYNSADDAGRGITYYEINVQGQRKAIELTNSEEFPRMLVIDSMDSKGLEEAADYSAGKTQYSYVTKKMLDAAIADNTIIKNNLDTYSSIPKVNNIVTLTQVEYDAIVTPDPNILYIIPQDI